MVKHQYQIGFVVRNGFQTRELSALCLALKGVFVAKKSVYNKVHSIEPHSKWMIFSSIAELNSAFDVLVMHGPISGIEKLGNTKVVMVQYGYAKAPYNYGCWRSLADCNLVYGRHAATAIAKYSPVIETGHPYAKQFKSKPKQSFSPARVLYAPTWGGLSSISRWQDEVIQLQSDFDLTIKLHHNSLAREIQYLTKFNDLGCQFAEPNTSLRELICENEVLISDYSGAIFDAILARMPVVLVDGDSAKMAKDKKIDCTSIEVARRAELGIIAEKGALRQAVDKALITPLDNQQLYKELFHTQGDSIQNMCRAVLQVVRGDVKPNAIHRQARLALQNRKRYSKIVLLLSIFSIATLVVFLAFNL